MAISRRILAAPVAADTGNAEVLALCSGQNEGILSAKIEFTKKRTKLAAPPPIACHER
jgi:hypothetical protein